MLLNIIIVITAFSCIIFAGVLWHLLFLFALRDKIDLKKYHILVVFLVRTLLIFIFSIFTIVLVELILRQTHTRYYHLANARLEPHADRGFTPIKNSRYQLFHPDTKAPHLVIYNKLALRQHRPFDEAELNNSTSLAFFGDSFTANLRMESIFSFTEVLDYLLLNGNKDKQFRTYNSGVDSYGLNQIYLLYKDFPHREKLNHVFYVACYNDVKNIYDNKLCYLNSENELVFKKSIGSSFLTRLISRLYLTYFVVEIRGIFVNATEVKVEEFGKDSYLEEAVPIFQKLLEDWKKDVESHGGKFHIILLPRKEASSLEKIIDKKFDVINLYKIFHEEIADYNYENFRFKNDYHWNEECNQLASIFLYKNLSEKFSDPLLSDEQIKEILYRYYSSFDIDKSFLSSEWLKQVKLADQEKKMIRDRYISLETQ